LTELNIAGGSEGIYHGGTGFAKGYAEASTETQRSRDCLKFGFQSIKPNFKQRLVIGE